MRPHKKNILFRPFPSDEKTSGGIIVSDAHKLISNKGEIVEVGEMVTKVKKGETVYRVKGWGQELELNGEKLYLMDESAILAKQ